MADEVNQNVKVDSGFNGFWIFLILAVVLVFMAVMFRGSSLPLPTSTETHTLPPPEGWEIVKDRDGRVVGIKPIRKA